MNHKEIVETILNRQGHTLAQIKAKNREHNLVFTKKLIGYFLKKDTKMSLNQIADEYFNGKHCRVLYYCNQVMTYQQYPKAYKVENDILNELEKLINPEVIKDEPKECVMVTLERDGVKEYHIFTDNIKGSEFIKENSEYFRNIENLPLNC
jgi:hypothetical protein